MDNPVAIITAASRGIGAACAKVLAADGYRLVLMARSDDVKKLASGLDARFVQGSVTSLPDLQRVVDVAMTEFGRVDAVINNTGHPSKGELLSLTDEDWHDALDLLLLNVVRMSRMIVPQMRKQGSGSIVNISTLGAEEPSLLFPISSTLRAGLAAFTRLFSDRYAADNIRMNNVLPGFADSYQVSEEILKTIPMSRPGRVAEVAETVAFLAGSQSSYISGQSIRVDGGMGRSL